MDAPGAWEGAGGVLRFGGGVAVCGARGPCGHLAAPAEAVERPGGAGSGCREPKERGGPWRDRQAHEQAAGSWGEAEAPGEGERSLILAAPVAPARRRVTSWPSRRPAGGTGNHRNFVRYSGGGGRGTKRHLRGRQAHGGSRRNQGAVATIGLAGPKRSHKVAMMPALIVRMAQPSNARAPSGRSSIQKRVNALKNQAKTDW